MYTVYDHPADYPDAFVVVRWLVGAGGIYRERAWQAPTLEAAREVIPHGLLRTERAPNDDSVIVETWL